MGSRSVEVAERALTEIVQDKDVEPETRIRAAYAILEIKKQEKGATA